MTTRALLRFVGSSHPAMTQPHPPPPVGVEFSLDNSTPPPSPWRVESSGDNSTPPSTPWRTLLEFFFHPEGLTPPSSHSILWGLGATLEALRPPEFPSTPQGSFLSLSCSPPFTPLCFFCAQWRLCVTPPLAVPEVTVPPPLPPALAPTRSPLAPLSCVPHGNTVSGAGSRSPRYIPLCPLPLRLPSPPPLWPCGRSPPPTLPCPCPRPLISPVGTKMSAIRRRGCCASVVGGRIRAPWKMAK